MKSYTDLEQSKKLAEILPLESADMIWYGIYRGMDGEHHLLSDEYNEFGLTAINKEFCKTLFILGDELVDWLPCWSLAALLNVLPSATLDSSDDHHYRLHCMEKYTEWHDNPVDACVAMIKRLHELNLL